MPKSHSENASEASELLVNVRREAVKELLKGNSSGAKVVAKAQLEHLLLVQSSIEALEKIREHEERSEPSVYETRGVIVL